MNPDAFVLALLAIADLAVLAHLRHRHAQRVRMERMMESLRFAVQRANTIQEMPQHHELQQAS